MLSLVIILCTLGWMFVMWKLRKVKAFDTKIITTVAFLLIILFLGGTWWGMFTTVDKIDTSYYQQ